VLKREVPSQQSHRRRDNRKEKSADGAMRATSFDIPLAAKEEEKSKSCCQRRIVCLSTIPGLLPEWKMDMGRKNQHDIWPEKGL
jgi:hypothetical protein